MDENETNQNDVTPEIDSNRGPSALDMPATNSDDEEEQAIWFYEENQEDETDLEPNAALVVVTGTDELKGSFMFNVKVGPNGELPYRKEGHYPEHLVERELPLRQPDGSINIGFSPKAECDLNVPGVIVYQYLDANQKVVANAIVVVWIVAGLDRPIVRRVAQDLLEKQTTMSIQHGQAYVACAARGEVLQLEVPHHSGYAEIKIATVLVSRLDNCRLIIRTRLIIVITLFAIGCSAMRLKVRTAQLRMTSLAPPLTT